MPLITQSPTGGSAVTDAVDYQTDPSRYKHWQLTFDGPIATLSADFDENGDFVFEEEDEVWTTET